MQFKPDTNNNINLSDEKDVKNIYDQEHIEAAAAGTRDDVVIAKDYDQYIHDAQQAVEGQKGEPVMVALKRWRRGVIYSIIFST